MKNQLFILTALLLLATLACSLAPHGAEEGDISSSLAPTEPIAPDLQTTVDQLPAGDATRGEQIFTSTQACHACHTDQSVGPQFPGDPLLATLAQTRRPGYEAKVYLYESIVDPGAYVVQGFQNGVMPHDYGKLLTQQDLADLVEYLLSLR